MANRCTAKSKTTGNRCKSKAITDKAVCYYHGGAAGSGSKPGNTKAVKHGIYARILHKTMSADDKALFADCSPNDDLENEIQVLRYRHAKALKYVESKRDESGNLPDDFAFPSAALHDINDLIRKMVKDKKDREFRASEQGDDNGSLDKLIKAIQES